MYLSALLGGLFSYKLILFCANEVRDAVLRNETCVKGHLFGKIITEGNGSMAGK